MHLSVIVPIYQAEAFLGRTLLELDSFLSATGVSTELLLVDDGSRDRTHEICRSWALTKRPYEVEALRLEENRGKGGAVAAGMLSARGKFRVFLDADLAYPPSQIVKVLGALEEGADVAVASRVHPDSRYTISPAFFHYLYTRHRASRVINWLMRRTIIPGCFDSQAGLKGFSEKAARQIFSRQIIRGFSFDVEALYLARLMGLGIREVAVEFRYFNEPTTVEFVKDGAGLVMDVLRVRWHSLKGRYCLHAPGEEGGGAS